MGISERYNLQNNSHIIEEIQQEISAAVISGSGATLAAVMRNFRRRLQMLWDTDGAHVKNVFM
jgi:homoserine kinase